MGKGALRRIEKAKREVANLSDLGLTELPGEISELKNLTSIVVPKSQVSDLFPISGLVNLTSENEEGFTALKAGEEGKKEVFIVQLIEPGGWKDLPIAQIRAAPSDWIRPGVTGQPRHELWAETGRKFNDALSAVKKRKLRERPRGRFGG